MHDTHIQVSPPPVVLYAPLLGTVTLLGTVVTMCCGSCPLEAARIHPAILPPQLCTCR